MHESAGTNKTYTRIFDSGEAGSGGSFASADADADADADAEAEAEIVIKRRYVQQRLIPAFMEPRSVIVGLALVGLVVR